jgi:mannose-6-phosphate isomerase-like protein (cupin superfamily)
MYVKTGPNEKGWGTELVFTSNDLYCAKVLIFKPETKTSMHFHKERDKTFFVSAGQFTVMYIDTDSGNVVQSDLKDGDVIRMAPMTPHQIRANVAGSLLEVGNALKETDIFRLSPGDTQTIKPTDQQDQKSND